MIHIMTTTIVIVQQDDSEYIKLKPVCIAPWLGDYDEKALIHAFDLAFSMITGIYAATHHQLKTAQHEHPGSIEGCLRAFINYCD